MHEVSPARLETQKEADILSGRTPCGNLGEHTATGPERPLLEPQVEEALQAQREALLTNLSPGALGYDVKSDNPDEWANALARD